MLNTTSTPRLAALLTCHNRRDLTVACLERLERQQDHDATIDVILVDAASEDGTAAAVRRLFPNATVLHGPSNLFWARGMHLAFRRAAARGQYDYYLWLNDDTMLDPDALTHLLATHDQLRRAQGSPLVVAGATRDRTTGKQTYGGMQRSAGGSPVRFESVHSNPDHPTPVDTMNGNCVLVSNEIVQRIGIIDPRFFHTLADFDYGLRAQAAGCEVWLAAGTVGTCTANRLPDTRWQRVRYVFGPRRIRAYEWYVFVRRWGGRRWPLLLPAPYVRHALIALSSNRGQPGA